MNALAYKKLIASEFGGLRKDELLKKLDKLVDLAKKNGKTEFQIEYETIILPSKMNDEIVKKEDEETPIEPVDNVLKIDVNKCEYDQCMEIITWARLSEKEQDLSVIPIHCMAQFLAICEINHSIEITDQGTFIVHEFVKNLLKTEE